MDKRAQIKKQFHHRSNNKRRGSRDSTDETSEEAQMMRLRLPQGRETLGILEQRVGGSRQIVRCLDGKTRICRIPGRLKRSLWVRVADVLIVEPWELSGDEKGDIIYKYTPTQVKVLKARGHLKQLSENDEF